MQRDVCQAFPRKHRHRHRGLASMGTSRQRKLSGSSRSNAVPTSLRRRLPLGSSLIQQPGNGSGHALQRREVRDQPPDLYRLLRDLGGPTRFDQLHQQPVIGQKTIGPRPLECQLSRAWPSLASAPTLMSSGTSNLEEDFVEIVASGEIVDRAHGHPG